MKIQALIAAIFLTTTFLTAQDIRTYEKEDVRRAYEENTMLMQSGGFEINQKKIGFGLTNKTFKDELKRSAEAWENYKVYRRKLWLGFGLLVASVPVGVAVGLVTVNPAVGLFVAIPPYVGGLVLIGQAPNYSNRAVWVYNRDMLLEGLETQQ